MAAACPSWLQMGRVRWAPWQRFRMGLAARIAPAWRDATLLVQPATILRWHRAGLRTFWRRRSRPSGRPPTARAALIREMATSNPRRGAEGLRGELLELGIRVCKRTVQRYMRRARPRGDGQSWATFPAESRRVGGRLRADLRHPVPRGLRALLPRSPAPQDRPRGGHIRAQRRVVRAASPERHHGGCAGGLRLRPRREARRALRPRSRIVRDVGGADRARGA
jgi:hypothetical protein